MLLGLVWLGNLGLGLAKLYLGQLCLAQFSKCGFAVVRLGLLAFFSLVRLCYFAFGLAKLGLVKLGIF